MSRYALSLDSFTDWVLIFELFQGYALIEYSTLPEARSAIEAINGAKLLDQTLSVDYAFVRPPPGNKGKGGNNQRGGRGGRARSRSRERSRSPGADNGRD